MTADVFLDTNILLYAAMGGTSQPGKKQIARRIILEEDYGTSSQVLAEFYSNAIRKGDRPMTPDKAREWIVQIARKPCEPISSAVALEAADISQRFRISYWDGAIVAAAERIGARTLYTEDLNHGQAYGSVTAINPFLESASA